MKVLIEMDTLDRLFYPQKYERILLPFHNFSIKRNKIKKQKLEVSIQFFLPFGHEKSKYFNFLVPNHIQITHTTKKMDAWNCKVELFQLSIS